ncbi:hypothetical protein [Sinorhizobium chiapasense]|uniref:Uncharacterized protein n=1 Tax=Sinorhizobium chiapasense TaxID=501572 RepID=A0ABZ2BB90_9HYPH
MIIDIAASENAVSSVHHADAVTSAESPPSTGGYLPRMDLLRPCEGGVIAIVRTVARTNIVSLANHLFAGPATRVCNLRPLCASPTMAPPEALPADENRVIS